MKISYLLGLVLLTSPAWADPLPACGTSFFSVYASYGSTGCSIGSDYVVKNASFTANLQAAVLGSVNDVNSTNLLVTPTLGPNGPQLLFSGDFGAFGGLAVSTYTGVLHFSIESSNTPFTAFQTNTLSLTGTRNGLLSVANVNEVNCVGGLLNAQSLACLGGGINVNAQASLLNGGTSDQAILSLSSAHFVDVIKTINVTGAVGGSATLSGIGQNFAVTGGTPSAVPEPTEYALIGFGLVGMVTWHQRSRRAAAVR